MDYSSSSDSEDYGDGGFPLSMMPRYDTKYKLAICSLFHPTKHGIDENSSKDIKEHYLCMEYLNPHTLYVRGADAMLSSIASWSNQQHTSHIRKHPTIRNYETICKNKGEFQLEIVKIVRKPTPGNEEVCILQTFWLKIFQKVYRKHLQRRKHIMRLKNLRKREITGRQYTRYNTT